MTDPYFFGYGSLVNARTHAYAPCVPATAHGWRRLWVSSPAHPFAFLSVTRDSATDIQGLAAPVPGADWVALDERETGYDRIAQNLQISSPLAPATQIAIYSVPSHSFIDAAHPILLSYLDVVLQGFGDVFGAHGVPGFLNTTDGWNRPILNDRAAPRYPRAQALSAAESSAVDEALAQLGCEIITDAG